MESQESYKQAYALHYKTGDTEKASTLYQEILAKFPNTKEASYARTQLENIAKDSNLVTKAGEWNGPKGTQDESIEGEAQTAVSTFPCPACEKSVSQAAAACPGCGHPLLVERKTAEQTTTTAKETTETLATCLLIVPIVGLLLLWFWVGESMLLHANANLTTTALIVLISSAVLGAVDASQIGMTKKEGAGPFTVAIAMVLLWLVAFPWYLSARKKVGAKSYGAVGLLLTILFVGSYFAITMMISEAVNRF